MIIDELRFYQLVKAKIGETETEALIHVIDKKVTTKFDQSKSELASKEDLSDLRAELLRSIYLTNLVQLIAIIASVVSIIVALKK